MHRPSSFTSPRLSPILAATASAILLATSSSGGVGTAVILAVLVMRETDRESLYVSLDTSRVGGQEDVTRATQEEHDMPVTGRVRGSEEGAGEGVGDCSAFKAVGGGGESEARYEE